jgi:hypothetical protein
MLAAFVITGILLLALPGTLLGVWNLISIAEHQASDAAREAWIQAHGQALLFGWVGTHNSTGRLFQPNCALPASGTSACEGFGGLRHARRDSTNLGWHNASFRSFADYTGTKEFEEGLERLVKFAQQERCALMCAEALAWRCHRSLIADALLVRGIVVEHILSPKGRQKHSLAPFARVDRKRISYPMAKPAPPPKAKSPRLDTSK